MGKHCTSSHVILRHTYVDVMSYCLEHSIHDISLEKMIKKFAYEVSKPQTLTLSSYHHDPTTLVRKC